MSSAFHNLASVKDIDDIGVLNAAQPMSNGNGCPALRSGSQCFFDNFLRRGVQS